MNDLEKQKLQKLASDLNIPENDLLVLLPFFKAENETLESITLKLSGDSTTTKFTNLRFQMGKLFPEMLESLLTAPNPTDPNYKKLFFVLRLIQKIRNLEVYPLSQQEAVLLAEMFRLHLEGEPISVDTLLTLLGKEWNQNRLITSLNNLERLGCISYSEAGVKLVEEIKFQ